MKKIIGLLAIFTLILSGCSSDGDGSDNNSSTYIKFKVNGQSYNYEPETIVSLKTLVDGYTGNGNTLKRISLWMPNEVATGTYPITDTPSDVETYNASYSSEGESIYIDGTSGTITITSVTDDYIKGTFSFSGDNEGATVNITNGEFKADKVTF
ncbi:DUF6252 family protein [Flavobacterium sp. H122]|uniref:DUF6252 family protein n=1 Tax=Flavobacterium sp. H122 TaxID=2529860 RepID=UPI0010A9B6B6|nr:DUF6252 family protein [Flavobacterium sp. H122]